MAIASVVIIQVFSIYHHRLLILLLGDPGGDDLAVDIAPTTRLSDLEMPPDFFFVFHGRILDAGTPLVQQGVRAESTIHATPRGLTRTCAHTTQHTHI